MILGIYGTCTTTSSRSHTCTKNCEGCQPMISQSCDTESRRLVFRSATSKRSGTKTPIRAPPSRTRASVLTMMSNGAVRRRLATCEKSLVVRAAHQAATSQKSHDAFALSIVHWLLTTACHLCSGIRAKLLRHSGRRLCFFATTSTSPRTLPVWPHVRQVANYQD